MLGLALTTNSRLGWTCLTLSNALAYYCKNVITSVKSFMREGRIFRPLVRIYVERAITRTGDQHYKICFPVICLSRSKLECFSSLTDT
jgi:hypothetical protein